MGSDQSTPDSSAPATRSIPQEEKRKPIPPGHQEFITDPSQLDDPCPFTVEDITAPKKELMYESLEFDMRKEYIEFLTRFTDKKGGPEHQRLYLYTFEHFRQVDTDLDGNINAAELDKLMDSSSVIPRKLNMCPDFLKHHGSVENKKEARNTIFKKLDESGSGFISLGGYLNWVYDHVKAKLSSEIKSIAPANPLEEVEREVNGANLEETNVLVEIKQPRRLPELSPTSKIMNRMGRTSQIPLEMDDSSSSCSGSGTEDSDSSSGEETSRSSTVGGEVIPHYQEPVVSLLNYI